MHDTPIEILNTAASFEGQVGNPRSITFNLKNPQVTEELKKLAIEVPADATEVVVTGGKLSTLQALISFRQASTL